MTKIFTLKNITKDKEILYISLEWSGDLEQAGRKLNFDIAYTKKDKAWTNANIELGDNVELSYTDENKQEFKIFSGVIFMQSRNSESYTMQFVAYDNLIYLAKSRLTLKFSNCSIKDCIIQVCNNLNIETGILCEDLAYTVDFIADNLSATEIIKKALETTTAWTGYKYHIYMTVDKKINVVRNNTKIDNFKLTDTKDVMTAQHSASIEEIINKVAITDKDGNISGYISNDDDIKKYGLITTCYKIDDKQNTEQAAKALLKSVKENSSLNALGNIQCISGFAVEIQEEQMKGTFTIISDSHKIENNVHTMHLTLQFLE